MLPRFLHNLEAKDDKVGKKFSRETLAPTPGYRNQETPR